MSDKNLAKTFQPIADYPLQVLWFSENRSHTIIFKGAVANEAEAFVSVPRTNVLIDTACSETLGRLFNECSNRELFELGVLPRCSNTIPAAIRKFLKQQCANGRAKQTVSAKTAKCVSNRTRRILIVDDDIQHCKFVKRALGRCGYEISLVQSADECLAHIARYGLPHLALIDIQMPGMNGIELSKRLHKFSDLPIIMFTAVDAQETITETITQYAEDYIIKPCSASELEARVGRILKRFGDFSYALNKLVKVDDRLHVDFYDRKVVITNQGSQTLTPVESKLLYILMRHAGQTVTNEFIANRLWQDEAHGDQLHVFIYRIRQKIEPDPKRPAYIYTERGVGYRFMPPHHHIQ